jgi:asparagine synthase (glutamine-hydrolysing)
MRDAFFLRQRQDGRSRPAFGSAPTTVGCLQIVWRGYIADPSCVNNPERFASSYLRWDTELARHVFGEFAVAIYDPATDTIVATHDDFGIVPLFYSEEGGELIVSTDLDSILQVTGLRALDEEFIADYIGEGWHFGSRTAYAHIKRLKPGESLICRNGIVRIVAGTPLNEEPLSKSESRGIEEKLLTLVTEAVAGSIHLGERVWCELSGGLDSSSVFSLAARANTPNLAAFSFVYGRSTRCDECEWISAVLNAFPTRWHTLDADDFRPFSDVPAYQYAEPTTKLLMGSRDKAYRRLLAEHCVDVVLTGEGGDGVFVGDHPPPYHLADYFKTGRVDTGLRELQRWAKLSEQKRPLMYWFLRFVLRPLIRCARREMIEYDFAEIPWITPEYAKLRRMSTRNKQSPAMFRKSIAASHYMEGIIRTSVAASMHYQESLSTSQFRHPLLYRPLVEFMQRVPWSSQVAPNGDRLLQRRAFAGVLPERIRKRISKPSCDFWIYSGLRDGIAWRERLTQDPRLVARGYADGDAWSQAVQNAILGRTVGIRSFLASASLEVWLQQLETKDSTRTKQQQ